nr:MAG TPA: hypothetical protein [Caudoviricetes sp.]DAI54056.1 MAG TPA: hypothetical protein [Caudoviricetes sp.]
MRPCCIGLYFFVQTVVVFSRSTQIIGNDF